MVVDVLRITFFRLTVKIEGIFTLEGDNSSGGQGEEVDFVQDSEHDTDHPKSFSVDGDGFQVIIFHDSSSMDPNEHIEGEVDGVGHMTTQNTVFGEAVFGGQGFVKHVEVFQRFSNTNNYLFIFFFF